MTERLKIFDVGGFKPKAGEERGPQPEQLDQVAGPKFRSREIDTSSTPSSPTVRQPLVYRTGRNVTFSAKTTQVTVDTFYDIARNQGWKAGETFEKAVAALLREIG
jgi:hypothetical protein